MARKLVFSADSGPLFKLAYEGFLATARGTSRIEHKLIDRIIDRLESISTGDEDIVPGFDPKDSASPRRRQLDASKDGMIIFEDSEYDFFKKSIDGIVCAAPMSRQVTRLNDFIDAAESGDAKKLAQGEELVQV